MTINDYQPLLSGCWDEDSLRPFGRVSGEKGERISQTNLMWNPPQLLACRDSGPSLSVKHNTDFFVHCLHHASHRVRMQNASHDLKILRVLRGISVFRRQTARYSLIGGWRCGDINSLSVEVLRWSTPQFTLDPFLELSGTNQQLYWTDLAECTHFLCRRNPWDANSTS